MHLSVITLMYACVILHRKHNQASCKLLSQVQATPARPVALVVLWWRVPAINNRSATFGSNWLVNEQCQLKWS